MAKIGSLSGELAAYDGFGWDSKNIAAIRQGGRHRIHLLTGKFRRSVSTRWVRMLAKTGRGTSPGEG